MDAALNDAGDMLSLEVELERDLPLHLVALTLGFGGLARLALRRFA